MNEDFRLDGGGRSDVAHLFERQFTSEHDSLETEAFEGFGPGAVVDGHLCAAVQLQLREVPASEVVDAEVLQDDRVNAHLLKRRERLDQFGQLVVADDGVDGDEDAASRGEAVSAGDDLVQLFHQSELLITNDSGPAHFASLTGIASITLFGPETARLYRPTGPRAVAIDKQLACSPCLTAFNHRNSICRDNQCLAAISVDEVFEHAKRLLGVPVRAATS